MQWRARIGARVCALLLFKPDKEINDRLDLVIDVGRLPSPAEDSYLFVSVLLVMVEPAVL